MLHQIIKWENILNTTGATSGSGTAYSPTEPEITYGFSRVHITHLFFFKVLGDTSKGVIRHHNSKKT
jgi:hypothetical protein